MSNLWEMAFVLEIYQYCHNHPPSLTPRVGFAKNGLELSEWCFFLKQKSLLSIWFEGRLWKCWGSEEAWSIDQGKWGGRCWTWTWKKLADENKNCQRQNGPSALSTLTHSTLLVQYLKYNLTKALLGIKLKLSRPNHKLFISSWIQSSTSSPFCKVVMTAERSGARVVRCGDYRGAPDRLLSGIPSLLHSGHTPPLKMVTLLSGSFFLSIFAHYKDWRAHWSQAMLYSFVGFYFPLLLLLLSHIGWVTTDQYWSSRT